MGWDGPAWSDRRIGRGCLQKLEHKRSFSSSRQLRYCTTAQRSRNRTVSQNCRSEAERGDLTVRFEGGLTAVSRAAGAKIRRRENVGKLLLLLVYGRAELEMEVLSRKALRSEARSGEFAWSVASKPFQEKGGGYFKRT